MKPVHFPPFFNSVIKGKWRPVCEKCGSIRIRQVVTGTSPLTDMEGHCRDCGTKEYRLTIIPERTIYTWQEEPV